TSFSSGLLVGSAAGHPHFPKTRKKAPWGAFLVEKAGRALLDLRFLELDVLARHRVVLLHRQLLGLGPSVLFGDVEIAGVGARDELDLDGRGLRHGCAPNDGPSNDGRPREARPKSRRTLAGKAPKSTVISLRRRSDLIASCAGPRPPKGSDG